MENLPHVQEVISCRKCPRLVAWREEIARKKRRSYQDWEYWGKPVPGFGDTQARVLVIGLAPGAHGANRTGRNFTGDGSGEFLYRALYKAGFANQPGSTSREDGLQLSDLYIAAVCRCVPPDNKPLPEEIKNCRPFLIKDYLGLPQVQGLVILGKIALDGTLAMFHDLGKQTAKVEFKHALYQELGEGLPWMITSYHPSRQNTQTGRLTAEMFDAVWALVRAKLKSST